MTQKAIFNLAPHTRATKTQGMTMGYSIKVITFYKGSALPALLRRYSFVLLICLLINIPETQNA